MGFVKIFSQNNKIKKEILIAVKCIYRRDIVSFLLLHVNNITYSKALKKNAFATKICQIRRNSYKI